MLCPGFCCQRMNPVIDSTLAREPIFQERDASWPSLHQEPNPGLCRIEEEILGIWKLSPSRWRAGAEISIPA